MKRCVITGASMGLGLSLAKRFNKEGYNLILIARQEEKLKQIQKELGNASDVVIFPYDLCDNPEGIANEIIEKYDDIELVINNAGIGISGEFLSHSVLSEERLIDLNIKALSIFSLVFGKYFKEKNKGTIMNISSVGSLIPGKYMASYYASKAYVSSFTYSLYLELKNTSINVLGLNLPRIDTDFDKNAKRVNSLKRGANPDIISKKIFKMRNKRGIKNIGLSTKLTNMMNHILPKSVLAFFIGDKLK